MLLMPRLQKHPMPHERARLRDDSQGLGINRLAKVNMNGFHKSIYAFLMFAMVLLASGLSTGAMFATCTGANPCHACKNCRYCAHCAKNGGTCGICKNRVRH